MTLDADPAAHAASIAAADGTDPGLESLRQALKADAILYATREQPIKDRNGFNAPWLFYSWNVTLSQDGLRRAGLALLERLRGFESTQLATYGVTGIPLLSSCVVLGDRNYTGVCIREARKRHGSCRLIEGSLDRTRPAVVIDDSLSSGTSLRKAIEALEVEGVEVEGALALVEFPWRGGRELAEALGYRVDAVFDVWRDLEMPRPPHVPGFRRVDPGLPSAARIDDGLAPAAVARLVAERMLSGEDVPAPPRRLDRDYDGRGGVYVSFRDRASDHRVARDGFWHFERADADVPRDVVLATVKTVRAAGAALRLEALPQLKVAVTFLGPLEPIQPRQLDFDRYGIVVRSHAWATKIGGALPNTQVFTSEVEQYFHARVANAKVGPFEPHTLYRHTLDKRVEAGAEWPPYGIADGPDSDWARDEDVGTRLCRRARAVLLASQAGEPVPDELVPGAVFGVSVTLYHRGTLGCFIAWQGTLDECLTRAAIGAANDERFRAERERVSLDQVTVVVSILHDREWLGSVSVERAARKLRLGLDSLAVQQGSRRGILLSHVAPHWNWTKEQFASALLQKAGIAGPPHTWATFKTASWAAHDGDARALRFGFTQPRHDGKADVELLAGHLMNSRADDGIPEYGYLPVSGTITRRGTAARVVHALVALEEAGRWAGRADWQEAGRQGLLACVGHLDPARPAALLRLPGYQPGVMADCQLLAGISSLGLLVRSEPAVQALAASITRLLRPDGRIAEPTRRQRSDEDHDYLPGAVLCALGRYWAACGEGPDRSRLALHLEWYRRRFLALHRWGMVGWHPEAWAVLHGVAREPSYAAFAFEVADWALDHQLEKNGAFLTDLFASGPSFHTAFVAEGIAAARGIARAIGDAEREARYARACRDAASFTSGLIIRRADTFCMRDPERALGGVRSAPARSDVRIDYVSHALLALIRGALASEAGAPT